MRIALGIVVASLLPLTTSALDFEYGGFDGALKTTLISGFAVRMQDRSNDLIGKQSIPGQVNLCPDSCISINGDPEPNLRLVRAAGAFSGVNADDGNLNYDRHDIVSATNQINADLTLTRGDLLIRTKLFGFYDPINVGFDERHVDTKAQPATTKRPGKIEDDFASGVQLFDAYVQYTMEFGERTAVLSVGNQIVRWGESTLVALNSLSELNPPNAAIFRMPGAEISQLFTPVPSVLLSGDLGAGFSGELVYQFGWKKVQPDPRGSFFSDLDLIGGDYAQISLGQFGEDPNGEITVQGQYGTLAAVSSTTTTTYLLPEAKPSDGGQYGARLSYYAPDLNDGTEFGFYFLNYHSRLPYARAFATDDSCARDATSAADALIACEGFNGSLLGGPGLEPLPIDTFKAQLAYPEDIRMFGVSFNTTVFGWSLAGELSYRPNLPLQVHLTDVIFLALQPALPATTIENDPTSLGAALLDFAAANGLAPPGDLEQLARLGTSVFPSADTAVPSFLGTYRGFVNSDDTRRIRANQQIDGWERMKVAQFDFTTIKALSDNPFDAEQIIFIGEVGGTYILNMPDTSVLQFEGGGPNRTHAGPGADGTGDTEINTGRLNPTQQTSGFADSFSWGLRTIIRAEYNDVIYGWNFKPLILGGWDVKGISPFPIQNFVEGRKEISAGTEISFTEALGGRVLYQWFTGGGRDNTRKDRDNLSFALSYTF